MMKQLFRLIVLVLTIALIPVISKPVFASGNGKFTLSPNTSTTIKTTTGPTQYITADLYFTSTDATPFFAIISQLDFAESSTDQVSYDSFNPDSALTAKSGLNVVQNDGNGKLDGDINGSIFLSITSSSPINSTPGTQVKLGTLKFKVLNPGTFTLGLNYDPAKTYVLDANDVKFTLDSSYSGAVGTYIIVPPTATPVTCTSFTPAALQLSTDIGSSGEKIYATADSTGGTKTFAAVWTPSTATFTPTAAGLTFVPAVGSTTNWVSTIPDNPSITANVDYHVTSAASLGSVSSSCTPFIIRVPKKVVDTACPATITSTQAKLSLNGSSWGTAKTITLGDPIRVAGFHSNSSTPMDQATTDMVLTVSGPQGSNSSTVDINDPDATDITKHNDISFTPPAAGIYTITATVKGKIGVNCTGQAVLTVVPVTVVTSAYRFSETPFDKTTPDTTLHWITTTSPTITIPSFVFTNPTIGQNLTLYAQFKSNTGLVTDVFSKGIKYIGPDPVVTNIACNFDSSTGTGSRIILIGRNFGQQGTVGAVKVTSNAGNSNATVSSWGPFIPLGSLPPAGTASPSASAATPSATIAVPPTATPSAGLAQERVVATIGERLSGNANVELTLDDGRKITRSCAVNTNTVSFATQTQCALPGNFSASNVRVQIAEDAADAKPLYDSRLTPIAIDAQGLPQWTPPALEVGKRYKLIIKTPKSIAVSQKFTVAAGTNVLQDLLLPVGDIAPATSPDGIINALDKAELNRQWNISSDTARTGDFNGDGRINSIDYSCMRQNINASSSGSQFLK